MQLNYNTTPWPWTMFVCQLDHPHKLHVFIFIIFCFNLDKFFFQEKMEKAANERQEKGQKLRGKRHKLSLTPATSHSVIPSRWPELPHSGYLSSGQPHNGYPKSGLPPSGYQQSGITHLGYQVMQNVDKDCGNFSSSIPVHRSLIVQPKSQSLDKLRYQRHKSVPRDFVIQKVNGNF